jgi:DNA-binding response OmpR family regulator
MRILYVEDSLSLQRSVSRALRHYGYVVDMANDGEDGLAAATGVGYDAIILDIMLPKLDGISVLQKLRVAENKAPVLLLTARDTVADRVEGLGKGADDYLIKPFALEELIARVQVLCRRNYGSKAGRLRLGPLVMDLATRQLQVKGEIIELTAREWRLLEYLALRNYQVVSRAEIEEHIYDEMVEPMSNVVDSAICSLRRKIGSCFIRTRRGHGYILEAGDS